MFRRGLALGSPWRACQLRERLLVGLLLGYVPGVLVVGVSLNKLVGSGIPVFLVAVGWMFALAFAGIALKTFPCPRCGKHFFRSWRYHNTFARKCVHCGLPKWAEMEHG